MKEIKSFKIYSNNNDKALNATNIIKEKLIKNGLVESDEYDLAIAVGGDGSFLRMVKYTNFNSDCLYVGINAGTLGFAQEVSLNNIDEFIKDIKNGNYKVDTIGVEKTKVVTNEGDSNFFSLNEIVIRDKDLNTAVLDVLVDDVYLEEYHGDGLLIATSFGSTAYNLSFGGSIIYNTFHTLQITPIAPLNNKSYRSLLNSVVLPEDKLVKIIPKNKNILVTIDGENKIYDNVLYIETTIKEKRIKLLRSKDYDFSLKINEKFLK